MRILICGGAGYIGSHVNKLLVQQGIETIVFDSLICGNSFSLKWGKFVQGDLNNIQDVDKVFSQYTIDVVIHLAAFAYVGESVDNPSKYYYNNIVATLNLLEVMKKHQCQNIIFSSTCATYGIPEDIPITEEMRQEPINPYGFTKLAVEHIFKDYAKAYGLRYVVLRYFNAAGADPEGEIGEVHNPETHIIPRILDAASGKQPFIKVFGADYDTYDGSCVRDYIHVSDLANAHYLSIKYLQAGKENNFFNLGNENGISIFQLIGIIKEVTQKDFKVVLGERREGDPAVLVGSSKKASVILNWVPQYDIYDIIKHAWNWHKTKETMIL